MPQEAAALHHLLQSQSAPSTSLIRKMMSRPEKLVFPHNPEVNLSENRIGLDFELTRESKEISLQMTWLASLPTVSKRPTQGAHHRQYQGAYRMQYQKHLRFSDLLRPCQEQLKPGFVWDSRNHHLKMQTLYPQLNLPPPGWQKPPKRWGQRRVNPKTKRSQSLGTKN